MHFQATALLFVPAVYIVAALSAGAPLRSQRELRQSWHLANISSLVALLGTLGIGVALLASQAAHVASLPLPLSGWPVTLLGEELSLSVRGDALTLVMLAMVTFIAVIILRFSQRYLDGEPGQPRFLRAFLGTMASVSVLAITNNLLVLALAWTTTSLWLHQLLTFYPDRIQARVAAHKKFLMSRTADLAIYAAAALLFTAFGTLELDALNRAISAGEGVSASVQAAGVLLVFGVALRSAQLPFHGWLIQVMEAPTPVSALLHAGVVNVGGFVLLRLAGLMVQLDIAQTLLVVIGALTATLAALVMTTRVSVKVALAWSTCAQMGFVLLECGLGAYELALLHLVAHSLYKANAFLTSGGVVERGTALRLAAPLAPTSPLRGALALLAALALTGVTYLLALPASAALGHPLQISHGTLAALFIFSVALAPILALARGAAIRSAIVTCLAAITLYLGLHALSAALATTLLPPPTNPLFDAASSVQLAVVVVSFGALYALQLALRFNPGGALSWKLYPAAFGGFYLDEAFTRMTFKLWPPKDLPPRERKAVSVHDTHTVGSAA